MNAVPPRPAPRVPVPEAGSGRAARVVRTLTVQQPLPAFPPLNEAAGESPGIASRPCAPHTSPRPAPWPLADCGVAAGVQRAAAAVPCIPAPVPCVPAPERGDERIARGQGDTLRLGAMAPRHHPHAVGGRRIRADHADLHRGGGGTASSEASREPPLAAASPRGTIVPSFPSTIRHRWRSITAGRKPGGRPH